MFLNGDLSTKIERIKLWECQQVSGPATGAVVPAVLRQAEAEGADCSQRAGSVAEVGAGGAGATTPDN